LVVRRRCRLRAGIDAKPAEGGADVKRTTEAADHVKAELIDPLHPATRGMTPTDTPTE